MNNKSEDQIVLGNTFRSKDKEPPRDGRLILGIWELSRVTTVAVVRWTKFGDWKCAISTTAANFIRNPDRWCELKLPSDITSVITNN